MHTNHSPVQVETLGLGQAWQGGDMKSTGGGYKLNLLRKALRGHENNDDLIILFTDGYVHHNQHH